jgi:hypothetical protein
MIGAWIKVLKELGQGIKGTVLPYFGLYFRVYGNKLVLFVGLIMGKKKNFVTSCDILKVVLQLLL